MAKLKVKEIGRNWWNRKSRRDIYVNGRHSGVLTGEEVEIEVEPDLFKRADSYASDCHKGKQHIYIRMDYVLPFQSQELFQDIRLL